MSPISEPASVQKEAYQQEQRRSVRIDARLKVDVHTKTGRRSLFTSDVSRHGMFLESEDPMRERHVLQISMHLPQGIFEATACVSRVLQSAKKKGAGLQLFTLSAEAKRAWDSYFHTLNGEEHLAQKRAPTDAPDDASSFVIKLKSKERLREFDQSSVEAGGSFLVTPVLRPIGSPVQMIMVHPDTDDEFILTGSIVRVNDQKPKGIEIGFTGLDNQRRQDFSNFVEKGQIFEENLDGAWDSVQHATPGSLVSSTEVDAEREVNASDVEFSPELGPETTKDWQDVLPTHIARRDDVEKAPELEPMSEPMDPEQTLQVVTGQNLPDEHTFEWGQVEDNLTIDLDIEEEATLWDKNVAIEFDDDDEALLLLTNASTKRSPPPPPASTLIPQAAHGHDDDELEVLSVETVPKLEEALAGVVMERVSARAMCSGCDVDVTFVVGSASGPLGLVADLQAFWAEELCSIVSVPRLRDSQRQRHVVAELGGLDSEILLNSVSARSLLEVAALQGSPRHPLTRDKLHEPEVINALRLALTTEDARAYVDLDGSCPSCGGTWTLVRKS
ncbi:MAG: PilZ domain-containing protein [Deltaproteobacteria bacterium]|nr:PilZ domain-containing protein [Deltaproteobacteria bacterium]